MDGFITGNLVDPNLLSTGWMQSLMDLGRVQVFEPSYVHMDELLYNAVPIAYRSLNNNQRVYAGMGGGNNFCLQRFVDNQPWAFYGTVAMVANYLAHSSADTSYLEYKWVDALPLGTMARFQIILGFEPNFWANHRVGIDPSIRSQVCIYSFLVKKTDPDPTLCEYSEYYIAPPSNILYNYRIVPRVPGAITAPENILRLSAFVNRGLVRAKP